MSSNGAANKAFHAGRLVARRLKASGIDDVFSSSNEIGTDGIAYSQY